MMFSSIFSEQGKFEIEYKGKTINAFYEINKKGKYILKFSFISVSSAFNQAILIHFVDFKGNVSINGDCIKLSDPRFPQLIFPEKETPKEFDVNLILESGNICICNASDPLGTGKIWHSLSKNCAMVIEKLSETKMRCHCNDHEYDEDFDDLVFELEIVEV